MTEHEDNTTGHEPADDAHSNDVDAIEAQTDAVPSGPTHSGFVALIGATNAGKSTLVNAIVGAKVTIVSRKVQTTRTLVRGIAMEGSAQLILVDTPGIFAPKRRLDRAMVHSAWSGAADADVLCLLIDARKGIDEEVEAILARQMPDAEKRARANVVIPTGGSHQETRDAVRALVTCLSGATGG